MFQILRRRETTERWSNLFSLQNCVKKCVQISHNNTFEVIKSIFVWHLWEEKKQFWDFFNTNLSHTKDTFELIECIFVRDLWKNHFRDGTRTHWHKSFTKIALSWSEVLLSEICVKNSSQRKTFPPFSCFHILISRCGALSEIFCNFN